MHFSKESMQGTRFCCGCWLVKLRGVWSRVREIFLLVNHVFPLLICKFKKSTTVAMIGICLTAVYVLHLNSVTQHTDPYCQAQQTPHPRHLISLLFMIWKWYFHPFFLFLKCFPVDVESSHSDISPLRVHRIDLWLHQVQSIFQRPLVAGVLYFYFLDHLQLFFNSWPLTATRRD